MEEKENLKFENELRKLKLFAENGAVFSEGMNLPAKAEKEWLDYMEYFNRSHEERDLIKVYDFISRPPYNKNLSDEEISEALNNLLSHMQSHHISLTTLCDVDDKELYRFIIEELFEEEIDNIKMEGMCHCFTYEDFHPNHEYDIQQYTREFIEDLFNKNVEYLSKGSFSNSFKTISGNIIGEEKLAYVFNTFVEYYEKLFLKDFVLENTLILNEEFAEQHININWEGIKNKSKECDKYQGKGVINFKFEFGYWYINGVNFPGLPI